jgi:hypothetical protein
VGRGGALYHRGLTPQDCFCARPPQPGSSLCEKASEAGGLGFWRAGRASLFEGFCAWVLVFARAAQVNLGEKPITQDIFLKTEDQEVPLSPSVLWFFLGSFVQIYLPITFIRKHSIKI